MLGQRLVTKQTGRGRPADRQGLRRGGLRHRARAVPELSRSIASAAASPWSPRPPAAWTSSRSRTTRPSRSCRSRCIRPPGLQPWQCRQLAFGVGLKGEQVAQLQIDPAGAVPAVPGEGRQPDRDQPADRHHRRQADGARLQARHRGQRAVPPAGDGGAARSGAGRSGRAHRQRARPELRLARWRHRLHGQRRGPGDGDDGPDQAARRRSPPTSSTSAAARPPSA